MAKKKKEKKGKKVDKKAEKKAAKKARKAAEKAKKKVKKPAKKAAKSAKKIKASAKPAKKAAAKPTKKAKAPARKPAPAKAKAQPAHHRLPPDQRHVVEEDEARERDGDNDKAFVEADTQDDEAKELGEEFVRSVNSGEEAESEMEEEETEEEQGGPFVVTSGSTEFGYGTDASNPKGAEVAGRPTVSPPVTPKLDDDE